LLYGEICDFLNTDSPGDGFKVIHESRVLSAEYRSVLSVLYMKNGSVPLTRVIQYLRAGIQAGADAAKMKRSSGGGIFPLNIDYDEYGAWKGWLIRHASISG
jgi:hypothetical protein